MRIYFILFFVFSTTANIIAQTKNTAVSNYIFYINKFEQLKTKNADSALYFLKKIADDSTSLSWAKDNFHNSFAQVFQKKWRKNVKTFDEQKKLETQVNIATSIVERLVNDSNKVLAAMAKPVHYWIKALENEDNSEELTLLTNKFLQENILKDFYANKTGRYALLIQQILYKHEATKKLSFVLLDSVMNKLDNTIIYSSADSVARVFLLERAWYRFLYAYSNYLLANNAVAKNDTQKAAIFWKKAFDFSPDLIDVNNGNGFFYEMHFLLEKEKRGFKDDYINFILVHNAENKEYALSIFLETALINPTYKNQLKKFYNDNFKGQENFDIFWLKNINNEGKPVPAFSLLQINNESVEFLPNNGKWIFLDFWGTWCGPCKKEHPDLEKFYKKVSTKYSDKLTVMTVACKDLKEKVVSYMESLKYTFPVAMASTSIEKQFNITAYPTKILISPEGKYIRIPFNTNWESYIVNYAGLE